MEQRTSYRGLLKTALALFVAAGSVASCGIKDDTDNCQTELRVKFKYDYNMKYADAFNHEVKTVHLYAYDESGRLALDKIGTVTGTDYTMNVDELKTGVKYDFYVWAEGESRVDSWFYGSNASASTLTATLSEYGSTVKNDITPLFHGTLADTAFAAKFGTTQTLTIPLVKNTNSLIVTLAEQDGSVLNPDDYDLAITEPEGNTHFNYDNSLLSSGGVVYTPWDKYVASAGDSMRTTINTVISEFTLSRLMADRGNSVRLTVTDKEGDTIIDFPLIDCILLGKGDHNRTMSDQEFLDREDTYRLTFFISRGNWLSAEIITTSWRVVLQKTEI